MASVEVVASKAALTILRTYNPTPLFASGSMTRFKSQQLSKDAVLVVAQEECDTHQNN